MQSSLAMPALILAQPAAITQLIVSRARALASLVEILVLVVTDTTMEDQPLVSPASTVVTPALIFLHA